jgi:hypothetical protein
LVESGLLSGRRQIGALHGQAEPVLRRLIPIFLSEAPALPNPTRLFRGLTQAPALN